METQAILYLMRIVIFASIIVIIAANACHYSCTTCTGQEYVSCLTCPKGGFVETVEDPTKMPSQYWSSVYPSGTCLATFAPEANALGIIFFLVIIGVCLFIRTKETFYLLITFQTYGLYNLIQIAWVNPIGYVLQGFQYLMIFNTIGYGYKTEDWILIASKNYRLNKYLQTTSIGQNLALIAAFTIIPLVLLIVLSIISMRKEQMAKGENKDVIFQSISGTSSKRQVLPDQTKEEEEQCCYCWKDFSETFLIPVAKFLLCFMFLMVQETCLVLLVTLVYVTPVSSGIIILCVLYLHILVFVMSFSYYYRIEYFKTKKIMYLSFAKKIILPVMVVVPIQYQYVFFIFSGSFLVLEFIFDNMNNQYRQFNRLAVYKVIEIITVLMLFIYYLVERFVMAESSSRAAAITCTFIMVLNLFIFVAVELPMSIKEKYFPSGVEEEGLESEDVSEKAEKIVQEDTLDNLGENEKEVGQGHVLIVDNLEEENVSRESSKGRNKEGYGLGGSRYGKNSGGSDDEDKNGKNKLDDRRDSDTKAENNSLQFGNASINDDDKDKNGAGNGAGEEGDNKEGEDFGDEEEKNQNGSDDDENGLGKGLGFKKKEGQGEEGKVKPKPKKKRRKQIIDPQLRLRYGM